MMLNETQQATILIIDDEPDMIQVLGISLKRSGYTIVSATSGKEALDLLYDIDPPDLIFLDVLMPELDGFETCQLLKSNPALSYVPIIFMTAVADSRSKTRAFEIGAVDYITKPFDIDEVLARAKNQLQLRELQMELQAERESLRQEAARRRWVLEALQESRAHYRFLAENSTDMIARQDMEGVYRYVSPACKNLLGYEIEEMISYPVLDFVHPEDHEAIKQAMFKEKANGAAPTVIYRACRKDGGYIWIETTVRVVSNPSTNHTEEIITVSRDVTDRKQVEEALEKARDELEIRVQTRTAELAEMNLAYSRFVPHEVIRFLDKESITDIQLGDQVQLEMTILFSDIRSFTTLSERMTPQENFEFLNTYLSHVSPIIREHQGFIDKYVGDEIMALFPENAENALMAAIDMQIEIAKYNQEIKQQDIPEIAVGIGFHTGRLMLGTIGETARMEGTVVSDAVNVASRLEGLTKIYGASIVTSDTSLFSIDGPTKYNFRFLDRVQVKGKTNAVSVFEIFDGNPEPVIELKLKTRTDFEKGLLAYHSQEFGEAQLHFQRVLDQNVDDTAAQLYLKRAGHFLIFGVPDDWEGVELLTEK
ncbi:MAG: response regulator [Chloroflexota bacterium]